MKIIQIMSILFQNNNYKNKTKIRTKIKNKKTNYLLIQYLDIIKNKLSKYYKSKKTDMKNKLNNFFKLIPKKTVLCQ